MVHLSEPAARAAHGPLAGEPVRAAARGTVLLVEDDPQLSKLLQLMLLASGYGVLGVAACAEAETLVEAAESGVDLVVLDVDAPDAWRPHVAERLRGLDPSLRMLYLSGYSNEALLGAGLIAAGEPFLEKPFSRAALIAKVHDVLQS